MIFTLFMLMVGMPTMIRLLVKINEVGKCESDDRSDIIFVGFILTTLLWAIIIFPVQTCYKTEYKKIEQKNIYSISSEVGIEGHFCLGFGNINSEMYYFYLEDGELGLTVGKIKASGVDIIEDENSSGSIEVWQKQLIKEDHIFCFGKVKFDAPQRTVIVVPKGTIKVQWNISV